MIANVLEATFAAETALMPYLPTILHEAPFALQNQDGFTARRAVTFGSTIGREAGSAEKPCPGADILNREARTDGRRVRVYGSIGREWCGAQSTNEGGERFLGL